ncbi:MAG: hypothetical protein AAFX65_13875 [Cyanobacteria bacterium J06638_7]
MAQSKGCIAGTYLAALEATTIAESKPQDQLGEVFMQVSGNELDTVTYQRLGLMVQQSLMNQRYDAHTDKLLSVRATSHRDDLWRAEASGNCHQYQSLGIS